MAIHIEIPQICLRYLCLLWNGLGYFGPQEHYQPIGCALFFVLFWKRKRLNSFTLFFFFSFLLNTFFEVRCHKALIKKRRIKWRIRYFFVLKCNQPYFITQMWNIWIMGRVQWALVLSFLDFPSGRAVSGPSETLQYEGDWLVWTCVIIWPDCGPVWIQISFILEKKKGLWKYFYIPNLLFFSTSYVIWKSSVS